MIKRTGFLRGHIELRKTQLEKPRQLTSTGIPTSSIAIAMVQMIRRTGFQRVHIGLILIRSVKATLFALFT